jgi:manganese oxidase
MIHLRVRPSGPCTGLVARSMMLSRLRRSGLLTALIAHSGIRSCVRVTVLCVALLAGVVPFAAAAGFVGQNGLAGQDGLAGQAERGGHGLELAGYEDYRESVGRMEGGVLRVVLDARAVAWRPWGDDGPDIFAHAFAADGAAPRVPAPLIRVVAGTPVHVTLRNSFDDDVVVRGLRRSTTSRPAPGGPPSRPDSVVVPARGVAEVGFTPTFPGTYIYTGAVGPLGGGPPRPDIPGGGEGNRAWFGVVIVDPADEPAPEDRVFLITHWADPHVPGSFLPATRFFINGRSWPHTERLEYAQGDTVRWRVLNMTGRPHPMHLHGFYFRVDGKGDFDGDVVYEPAERRLAVTETLQPTRTMRLTWVPEEPGNWVFHCHFMRHMSWLQTSPIDDGPPTHYHGDGNGEDLLGGLVLGIAVRPGPDYEPSRDLPRRRLDLHIGKRPGVFGDAAGYGFVLQEGDAPPAADSVRFPGSPIVLTRGEPTEIMIHNRSDVALGVHWHGLELESWADGVPGWSGMPGRVVPAVAPGDSFAVRMTPPRAGTFMYHVHSEPGHQLAQGLYGPFLVLEPGATRDPETDRVFLLGSLGAGEDPPAAVNGELDPGPITVRAGVVHRLRFMHISPDDDKRVTLLAGDEPVEWRLVAKDGADLPPAQVRTDAADLRIHVGETYDFLWTPEGPGDYTLRIVTTFDQGAAAFRRDAPPPHTAEVRVRVAR